MEEAQVECLDVIKPLGRVVFLGIKSESTTVNVLRHFLLKEIVVTRSWASRPNEHPEIIEMIQNRLPAERLITHRFKIDDAPTAFKTFFNDESVKVIINPWD